MYLTKKTYVGNKYLDKSKQIKVVIPKEEKENSSIAGIKSKRIDCIIEEIGYWRKANQIHKWFVDNVQNGNDDCKDYYVDKDNLEELLTICNKVIKASNLVDGKIRNGYGINEDGSKEYNMVDGKYIEDSTVAKELLPVQEGFFFGNDSYDEYYLEDVKYTKKMIEKLLKEEGGDFYYNSSW